jgi:hypothetical protein
MILIVIIATVGTLHYAGQYICQVYEFCVIQPPLFCILPAGAAFVIHALFLKYKFFFIHDTGILKVIFCVLRKFTFRRYLGYRDGEQRNACLTSQTLRGVWSVFQIVNMKVHTRV